MKIGYIRVSTEEQNTIRQESLMEQLGVEKVYIDKATGSSTDRSELQSMMEFIREGDTLIVESISRFARNTRDLLDMVDQLSEKGVTFISQKESIDTTTPAGKFMLTVFGAMAQLERDYIRERQREGIELAKERGVYKGRKPLFIDKEKWETLFVQWKAKEITATAFMKEMGLKSNTFYRRANEYQKMLDKRAEAEKNGYEQIDLFE